MGQSAAFAYDSRDNLASVTDPKGQLLTSSYDDVSRLIQVATPDNTLDFAYDPAGNLTAAGDDDSDLAFTYDDLNRLSTAATQAGGLQPLVTLTNSYNALSERVTLADSLGGSQAYAYDAASRLTQLTTPASVTVDLAYDPAGRLTSITRPNGVDTAATYDPMGRLQSLTHGAPLVASFTYGYDAASNITAIAELGQTRNFVYDALERVIAGGIDGLTESYSYDALGNRISSHLSASHVTDAANRLLEDDDFTYSYDANGILTTKTAKSGGAVTTYTYNAQDELTRIDLPGGSIALYAYDALGRRIQKDVDGSVTAYLYDGEDILLEFDTAGTLAARYGHGDRTDQPLVLERGGQSYHYHSDHLGSIRKLTSSTGAVVNSTDYDAYGNRETVTETVANPYGYTGREYDPESGLYYYRARYYDPKTGRFLSEDPIGFQAADANFYRYVLNNPVNLTDPGGLVAPAIAVCFVPGLCPAIGAGIGKALVGMGAGAAILSMSGDTPDDDEETDAASGSNQVSVPDIEQCIGDNAEETSGRFNSDLPGGQEAAEKLFEELAEGNIKVDPETGKRTAENKVQIRPGTEKDPRPRVDVPADVGNAGKHETIHFNPKVERE